MRALRDIIASPYARHVVAKYTAAGTYTLSLAPGKYHVVVVGAGSGAATAGWKTGTSGTSLTGRFGYSTGSGGCVVYGELSVLSSGSASIMVGAGGAGTEETGISDEAPASGTRVAVASAGANTSFSFESSVSVESGGGGVGVTLPRVAFSTSQGMVATVGQGGSFVNIAAGFQYSDGQSGTISVAEITEIADGTAQLVDGGLAGTVGFPSELGVAGKGGDVVYGYANGVLTFYANNGQDGGVLVERIG